jgi:CBS domain-containing protein
MTAAEIMGSPLVSVLSTDTLATVVRQLSIQGIRHVPVLDRAGALVGLVTQSDLLRACAEVCGILTPRP